MEVVESEAAPGGAEDAEPGDAVLGIEQSAGQGEGVEDFGAGSEFFQIDGAEWNFRVVEGLGDGGEGVAGAAEDGDAVLFLSSALTGQTALLNAARMAANQIDNFVCLEGKRGWFTAVGVRCNRFVTFGL